MKNCTINGGCRIDKISFYDYALQYYGTIVVESSVTRFGEISPFWQNFISHGKFCKGLVFAWQYLEPTLPHFYALGHIFIVVNGQRLIK